MNEIWKKPPVSLESYLNMVGQEVGISAWHLVDQKRIDVYADVTEDRQFIHVDPRTREERNRVRHHDRAWFPDDVAAQRHVL